MKSSFSNSVRMLPNTIGMILITIIFPSLAAITLGNELALSFGWESNTWGASLLRLSFAIGLVGISGAFILKNIRLDDQVAPSEK